jgi:hypothetical protein
MNFLLRHRKLTAIAIMVYAVVLYFTFRPPASVRGQRAAQSDISRGRYAQLGYGLPTEWTPDYVRLLRERYGVEYRVVAGDVLSQSEAEYYGAYNAVTTDAANRRFAHDIFKECAEAARKNYSQNLPDARTRP